MNILVTGARSTLARVIVDALAAKHHVDAVDIAQGDLRDVEFVARLVAGKDVIVHLAPLTQPFADENTSLDHNTRGTFYLAEAAAKAGVKRLIHGSSLALFPDALLTRHFVDAYWRPRPTTRYAHLSAWLGEVCARETTRSNKLPTSCLRFGALDATLSAATAIDAVQTELNSDARGWRRAHIDDRLPDAVDSAHAIACMATRPDAKSRDIRNVVVFGAGGPLGSVVIEELSRDYSLRLTDLKPLDELLSTQRPQSEGAPLLRKPDAKHEWRVVDVRDSAQVLAACDGMDAIINLSVLRNVVDLAFEVNMLGARNVMAAAVAHGIQRVVHTGPFQLGDHFDTGYDWDYEIIDDVPPRPGTAWPYFLSKLCGQEIVKIYAREHALSVPALTFCEFYNPEVVRTKHMLPLAISWADSARAVRAALEAESLPTSFEYFHIGADLPHDVFSNAKAKRLLNFYPLDTLDAFHTRPPSH